MRIVDMSDRTNTMESKSSRKLWMNQLSQGMCPPLMCQDNSMQQYQNREQVDGLISQLCEWWQLVQSPEVGYSWCGEARTERSLGQQDAVEFRHEFAFTLHCEALELVTPYSNDLQWSRMEGVAKATGMPQWFGSVLKWKPRALLHCPGEPTGWCIEAMQVPGKTRQNKTM